MTFAEPPTEVAAFTDYGLQRGLGRRIIVAAAGSGGGGGQPLESSVTIRGTQGSVTQAATVWGRSRPGSPDVGRYDIDIGVPFWTHELKASEVTPGVPIGSWSQQRGSLQAQIQQLEHQTQSELQRLSQQIEMLRRTVEASLATAAHGQYAPTTFEPLRVEVAHVAEANARGMLAQLFDQIANEEATCAPEIVDVAVQSLASEDPKLRAAAARVVSFAAPARAAELLPERIAVERNRFVASVLRSALLAART